MKRSHPVYPAALMVAALAGTVLGQPVFVATDAADDIEATGMRTVGRLLEWTGSDFAYIPYIWTHGQGVTRVPTPNANPAVLVGSGDLNALAMGLPNYANWGNLNCFNGYCQSWSDCPLGTPVPSPNPCPTLDITNHYTPGTGWVNAGSIPRELDAQSGRFYGGTHCGTDINQPTDISANGRYVVGNGWWSPLTNSEGGPSYGLCGDYRGFIYDSVTQSISTLPLAGGLAGKAQRVNGDGSVVTGTSPVEVVVDEFSYFVQAGTVWVNGVATVLDTRGEGSGTFAVNGAGTVVVGGPSQAFIETDLGLQGAALVKWTKQPDNTWLPQSLGRPADRGEDPCVGISVSEISADGSTVIGVANYRDPGFFGIRRPFIWRQSINGGVPIDLVDYLGQIGPGTPFATGELVIENLRGISANGNALLVSGWDYRNTCTNTGAQSHIGGVSGVLHLDGTGIACEPSRIAIDSIGWTETQDLVYIGSALNVTASGTWPLNYQWQREDPTTPGNWINLQQDCTNILDPETGFYSGFAPGFAYEGTQSRQLRIGSDPLFVCERVGRYRVIVSNACGSVTSNPVEYTTGPAPYTQQPADTFLSFDGRASFSVTNGISNDSAVSRWELELPAGSGTWVELVDGAFNDPATGLSFTTALTAEVWSNTRTLDLSSVIPGTFGPQLRVRNRIDAFSTGCGGTLPSSVATLSLTVPCGAADLGSTGGVPGPDTVLDNNDFIVFIDYFFNGDARADFGSAGGVEPSDGEFDNNDFIVFIDKFFAGC